VGWRARRHAYLFGPAFQLKECEQTDEIWQPARRADRRVGAARHSRRRRVRAVGRLRRADVRGDEFGRGVARAARHRRLGEGIRGRQPPLGRSATSAPMRPIARTGLSPRWLLFLSGDANSRTQWRLWAHHDPATHLIDSLLMQREGVLFRDDGALTDTGAAVDQLQKVDSARTRSIRFMDAQLAAEANDRRLRESTWRYAARSPSRRRTDSPRRCEGGVRPSARMRRMVKRPSSTASSKGMGGVRTRVTGLERRRACAAGLPGLRQPSR
jgi:hypothetical protein